MISKAFSKSQVNRLRGRMFDPPPEQIQDLVNALGAAAEDEDHARQVVDTLADDGSGNCPMAADIRRIAYETRRTETRPNPDCQKCFGSGWQHVEKLVTVLGREEMRTSADRCDCWSRAPRREAVVPPPARGKGPASGDSQMAESVRTLAERKELPDRRSMAGGDR